MSVDCRTASSSYDPSDLVEAFHSIPHIDINLNEAPSVFDPSISYFESVIIWACVPVLVCLCVFILLSVYFICVCCCCCCREKRSRSRANIMSCAFVIILLLVFSLGLVGVIMYAEVSLDKNIKSFISSGQSTVNEINQLSASLNNRDYNSSVVDEAITYVISEINGMVPSPERDTALANAQLIMEANQDVQAALTSISGSVDSIQYSDTIDSVEQYETIRNWTIIGLFIAIGCLLILTCLITLCRKSACTIIVLLLMIVVTVLVWLLTGGVLATSIVVADICNDPDSLIRNYTGRGDNTAVREVVDYFISCQAECRPNEINESYIALRQYSSSSSVVSAYIRDNNVPVEEQFATVQAGFATVNNITNNVSAIINCNPSQGIREYYISALDSFCKEGELYIVITLSMLSGLALTLFLLICCLSCYAGILVNTSHDDEIDNDDIVAFDSDRANTWSSGPRRLSYSDEPYATRYDGREEVRMNGLRQSPPKYSDLSGGRPGSGEYDHFDV